MPRNDSGARSGLKGAADIGRFVAPILEGIGRMREMDSLIRSSVTACPGKCEGGRISVRDGVTGKVMTRPCHLMTPDCGYGQLLMRRLDAASMDLLRICGAPTRFMAQLVSPRRTIALQKSLAWNRKGFLTITGPTGTGKSFAAASVLFEATRSRMERTWNDPTQWSKSAAGLWLSAYRVSTSREDFALALSCGFLVLDDLGEEVPTPAVRAAMKEIVSERYNRDRPTIVTSNLSIEAIRDRYGDRMVERLVETGKVIECSGESMRLGESAA
jgi:hypothetical protein